METRSKESRAEATMPIGSRVDLVTLANLIIFWENQGMAIKSVSMLVSWTLDAFMMIMENSGKMEHGVKTLEVAYQVLEDKRLLQKGMKKRMSAKFMKSRAMENLRLDGLDARSHGGRFYEELHPRNEVEASPFGGRGSKKDRDFIDKAVEKYHELEEGDRDADVERQKERAIKRKIEEEEKANNKEYFKDMKQIGGGGGIFIDTEANVKRALENDRKIAEDDMMPPSDKSRVVEGVD